MLCVSSGPSRDRLQRAECASRRVTAASSGHARPAAADAVGILNDRRSSVERETVCRSIKPDDEIVKHNYNNYFPWTAEGLVAGEI